MTDRRAFVATVSAHVLLAPLAVHAQQRGKKKQIGFLQRGNLPLPQEFWRAMREFDWIDGQNIEIVTRVAENRPQVQALAADLVQANVDLILVFGSGPAGAAKEATSTIPVVFSVGSDPVDFGLVSNLARPGRNLTGFAIQTYDQKLLEILKEVLPQLPLVAYPAYSSIPAIINAAHVLGMRVVGIQMQSVDVATDVGFFYSAARNVGAGAIIVPEHPALGPFLERFAIEATRQRLPAISYAPRFAEAGGLLAYGPNRVQEFQIIAAMINKIFSGEKPGDLPVELPTKFDLVINLKTAKVIGITIPQLLLLRATEVIG